MTQSNPKPVEGALREALKYVEAELTCYFSMPGHIQKASAHDPNCPKCHLRSLLRSALEARAAVEGDSFEANVIDLHEQTSKKSDHGKPMLDAHRILLSEQFKPGDRVLVRIEPLARAERVLEAGGDKGAGYCREVREAVHGSDKPSASVPVAAAAPLPTAREPHAAITIDQRAPRCPTHGEWMLLSFYDRPGSPPGNGWVCRSCARERAALAPAPEGGTK